MKPDHDTGDHQARIQELELEVERLEEENRVLSEERDRAVKAQDALLEKVIPLAVPGASSHGQSPSNVSRVFTFIVIVLLLVAVAMVAHHFQDIVQAMSNSKQLPPSIRVQEQAPR